MSSAEKWDDATFRISQIAIMMTVSTSIIVTSFYFKEHIFIICDLPKQRNTGKVNTTELEDISAAYLFESADIQHAFYDDYHFQELPDD